MFSYRYDSMRCYDCVAAMRWIIAILPFLLICGCRTKYITTEVHSTDTLSIHDTMTITDTLYLERIANVNTVKVDSNTTDEFKTAKIKITHFDSVGRVAKVTDIDLSSEKKSKSGGKATNSTEEKQVKQAGHKEQASHKEQAGSKTDIETKEVRVPYVPWWVTVAGILAITVVIVFFIIMIRKLVKKLRIKNLKIR